MPAMSMPTYPSPLLESLFYRALLFVGIMITLVAVLARGPIARMARRDPIADGTGDPVVRSFRDTLSYALGFLWLLDGVLQAQPLMVNHFVGGALLPLLAGQPAPVRALLGFGIRVWTLSPVWLNVAAVWLQVSIGFVLLFGRGETALRRWALRVSLGWALLIWVFGEGFGSVFAGGGPLIGSPGSALLYALAAWLVLQKPATTSRQQFSRVLRFGFAGYFLLMAALQALPASGFWHGPALSDYIGSMAAMPQPVWTAGLLQATARLASAHPGIVTTVLVATAGLLGILWFLPAPFLSRRIWVPSLIWVLAVWVLGQDFGVLGGMGTDPNTGGILLVFVLLWARHSASLTPGRMTDGLDETPGPGDRKSSAARARG